MPCMLAPLPFCHHNVRYQRLLPSERYAVCQQQPRGKNPEPPQNRLLKTPKEGEEEKKLIDSVHFPPLFPLACEWSVNNAGGGRGVLARRAGPCQVELLLASVEGDSSLDMLTPGHETKRGDGAKSQCSRAINKIEFEKKKSTPHSYKDSICTPEYISPPQSWQREWKKEKKKEPWWNFSEALMHDHGLMRLIGWTVIDVV